MKYKKALFIFRRDMRLYDNKALEQAAKLSEIIIPCFIFDQRQIGSQNHYRSSNSIQFMLQSLQDLEQQLKKLGSRLYIFHGIAEKIIAELLKKEKIDAVFCNRDYTPFSQHRDTTIQKECSKQSCAFEHYGDALLIEPEDITTAQGSPYTVFTPFYRKAFQVPVAEPKKLSRAHFYAQALTGSKKLTTFHTIIIKNNQCAALGGRTQGLEILKNLARFKDYAQEKDFPAASTTHLSAHLKFGTLSIRETFHAIEKKLGHYHPLLRQLYWRDFFTHVAYHSPFVFGQPYHAKYKQLAWSNDKKKFNAWCKGMTGFPIVDAGMRELNTTGFMHNRVRMIVASFLVKDLHINWLWGEKYFAQHLVDYDPALNNGNWQWVASTGCDAQPYFRIFNPWLQQKKFDPQCVYIKKWVAELQNLPPKIIHTLYKIKDKIDGYPSPLIDHDIEAKKAKNLYRASQ